MKFLRPCFFLLLAISAAAPLWAQFPEIKNLNPQDTLFKQLGEQISLFYQSTAQGREVPDLIFFTYKVKTGDSVYSLGARFNLPYETLTSLNNLNKAQDLNPGLIILVPSHPGLFVSADQSDGMAEVMGSWRKTQGEGKAIKIPRRGQLENYLFYARERYHPIERAFFMGILFSFPIDKGYLTSQFGQRANPFNGHPSFHNGIDIGAPTGTAVHAARAGVVTYAGWDRIYGNYVKLSHTDGYETIYGHLSKIEASLNESVISGKLIGKVGTTGLSTGPHLHFEIRRKGHPQDPVPLLPGKI